jgi:hypothetical protein
MTRLKGRRKHIPVRFPDGSIVEIRPDDKASIAALESKIAEQTQS